MNRIHKLFSQQTLSLIDSLLDQGINNISVLIRHSERHFSTEARMEPFMELTQNGKTYAYDFGHTLRPGFLPKLYSSFMGRCIETAYLIEKGFTAKHGVPLEHNTVDRRLSPFYIKNIDRAVEKILVQGNDVFIRNWFDGKMDESIIENPEKTADMICRHMVELIQNPMGNQVAVCITHDWNIFPVKEFKLGLRHEDYGDVGYLEGLVFFRQDQHDYVSGIQTGPVRL